MAKKQEEITIFGNNGEYSDWDVLALVYMSEELLRKRAEEFFRKTIKYKMVNPLIEFRHITLFWCTENSYDEWVNNTKSKGINLDYYTYRGRKINSSCFVPTTIEDSKFALEIIDREKFLEYLKELHVKVLIVKNDDCGFVA